MALYHLSVKPVSRAGGRSAVACAAYRSADVLHDQRTGQVHDYERKRGVEATMLLMPGGAGELLAMEGAGCTAERERLWNAAEAAEKRKDARVAREYEVALPHELDAEARRRLMAAFGRELVGRYGVAVDAAIHAPGREGDQRNWHAHVLATTRKATAAGLGEKAEIELSDAARGKLGLGKAADEIEGVRALWGGLVNRALEHARVAERVDHRSYERQGRADLAPTQHMGPGAQALERQAERKARERVAAEAPGRPQAALEAVQGALAPSLATRVPERPQEGLQGPQEAARAVPAPGAAPEPAQGRQEAPGGPREALGAAQEPGERPRASEAPRTVPGGPERPQAAGRASAAAAEAGPEPEAGGPVTRIGRHNAEVCERNRLVQAAREVWEAARARVERLERAAMAGVQWVAGLARGLGAQAAAAREREAERQRQERARAEAERRAEQGREARARQAAELRQRQEAERAQERPEVTQAQRDAARARGVGGGVEEAGRRAREASEAARRQQAAERGNRHEREGPSLGM